MLSVRHMAGLIFVVVLLALLYLGWEFALPFVTRSLGGMPALRTAFSEFQILIAALLGYGLLTAAQWLWDKTSRE